MEAGSTHTDSVITRPQAFAAATAAGALIGLVGAHPIGDGPVWTLVTAAFLIFPAAVLVIGLLPSGNRGLWPATVVAAAAGGLLAAVLLRIAISAPFAVNEAHEYCGGASISTQQKWLWVIAAVFLASAVLIAAMIRGVWRRAGGHTGAVYWAGFALYPLAAAVWVLAGIIASGISSC